MLDCKSWDVLCSFTYLQANILFKQFELETTVDRVLVYVTLYIVGWVKFFLQLSFHYIITMLHIIVVATICKVPVQSKSAMAQYLNEYLQNV